MIVNGLALGRSKSCDSHSKSVWSRWDRGYGFQNEAPLEPGCVVAWIYGTKSGAARLNRAAFVRDQYRHGFQALQFNLASVRRN